MKNREMKRFLSIIAVLTSILCMNVCLAENLGFEELDYTEGNVIFDAKVFGSDKSHAPVHKVMCKTYNPEKDNEIIQYLSEKIPHENGELKILKEEKDDCGRIVEREYGTDLDVAREFNSYYFYDGTIGANTYESSFYRGVMDITSLLEYDGACYIPNRTGCGNLPGMTSQEAAQDLLQISQELGLNIEATPYILCAYSMDSEIVGKNGIRAYRQMIVQGNDLTAENLSVISSYGSNCYLIAYRYEFNGIPVSYSYHYIESKDYTTLLSHVQALYNDRGLIQFCAFKQLDLQETSNEYELVTVEFAATKLAEHLNQILGVEPFVCKEISLEYIPFAYKGCDLEHEAVLIPSWVFYFDNPEITPILMNAVDGTIIS